MSTTESPETILNQYKSMGIECSNIAAKVHELITEKEEHRLVLDQLGKFEGERRAYRLIGGVLVEKTVGEILPIVNQNFDGVMNGGLYCYHRACSSCYVNFARNFNETNFTVPSQLSQIITSLESQLSKKDEERKEFKAKHGIMTQVNILLSSTHILFGNSAIFCNCPPLGSCRKRGRG